MEHCPEDRIIEYVRGRFSTENAERFERHLPFCRDCSASVAEWRQFIDAMNGQEAPASMPPLRKSLSDRHRRDEELARAATAEMLTEPPSSWGRKISSDPRLRSAAGVRELLSAAGDAFDTVPSRCREITAAAVRLVDAVSTSAMVPLHELRVEAYKDLANVTRLLGDFDEAARLLEIADDAAAACVEPNYQHSIVAFARSILLTDQQQWATAMDTVRRARVVFRDRDRHRYILTFHQEAIIYSQQGDYLAATRTFNEIVGQVAEWGDDAALARLYTTAAFAFEGANELVEAKKYLLRAIALHVRGGHSAELARDSWRLGLLWRKMGRYSSAIKQMLRARPLMLQHGLKKHVLSLDFDVLEAMIEAAAPAAEIVDLCKRIIESSADLPVNAAHAVAWLREYAVREEGHVPRSVAESVRQFVIDSRLYPNAVFAPPPTKGLR